METVVMQIVHNKDTSHNNEEKQTYEELCRIYEEYSDSFFEERRVFRTQHVKEIARLRKAWIEVAIQKIDVHKVDEILLQVNKKTSKRGVFIIAMKIAFIVGTDPLMFAPSLEALHEMKSFFTRLFKKVKNKL